MFAFQQVTGFWWLANTLWLSNVIMRFRITPTTKFLISCFSCQLVILIPNTNHISFRLQLLVLYPHSTGTPTSFAYYDDPKTRHLETLISNGFTFNASIWLGGDSSLPPLKCSLKRKLPPTAPASSSFETDSSLCTPPRSRAPSYSQKSDAVNKIVDQKLHKFKESILDEMRQLLNQKSILVSAPETNKSCHLMFMVAYHQSPPV